MKRITAILIAVLLSVCLGLSIASASKGKIVVGSKEFTEQRILGNLLIAVLEDAGYEADDKTGLGGTLVVREALKNEQIDIYMAYNGTILMTALKHKTPITDPVECYNVVKKEDLEKNGIVWLSPSTVNNTYCLVMRNAHAKELGISSLSDLAAFINKDKKALKVGLNAEFYARPDGYPKLKKAYGFKVPMSQIVKMRSGLLYNAIRDKQADVTVAFATDGRIKGFDLVVLEDDKKFFPAYTVAPIIKKSTIDKYPDLPEVLKPLTDALTDEEMTKLNYQVDIEKKQVKDAAREWLKAKEIIK